METKKIAKVILSIGLGICAIFQAQAQQQNDQVCKLGLEYQRSNLNNWGKGYPVIISVQPNSTASKTGFKAQDIITSIDGINTKTLSDDQFNRLMLDTQKSHIVKIQNYHGDNIEKVIMHDCKSSKTLTERHIAEAFAFYSLEDMNERRLTYPLIFQTDSTFNFAYVKRYVFAASSPENKTRDNKINSIIRKYLNNLGLIETAENPDFIIDNYYSMTPNSKVTPIPDMPSNSWRYNFETSEMDHLPLLPIGIPKIAAPYSMNLGVKFTNAKNNKQVLWKCEARELLSAPMSVEDYAGYVIPMMMIQYPFVRNGQYPTYRFGIHRYNYTGILYNKNDLGLIEDVIPNSPAFKAGLRKGDRINSINGIEMKYTDAPSLSKEYIKFIDNTNEYRDLKREFTNSDRLAHCRYWNSNFYKNIAKKFAKKKYNTIFSYLFFFRPYINRGENNQIIFNITRGNDILSFIVDPVKMDESSIIPD